MSTTPLGGGAAAGGGSIRRSSDPVQRMPGAPARPDARGPTLAERATALGARFLAARAPGYLTKLAEQRAAGAIIAEQLVVKGAVEEAIARVAVAVTNPRKSTQTLILGTFTPPTPLSDTVKTPLMGRCRALETQLTSLIEQTSLKVPVVIPAAPPVPAQGEPLDYAELVRPITTKAKEAAIMAILSQRWGGPRPSLELLRRHLSNEHSLESFKRSLGLGFFGRIGFAIEAFFIRIGLNALFDYKSPAHPGLLPQVLELVRKIAQNPSLREKLLLDLVHDIAEVAARKREIALQFGQGRAGTETFQAYEAYQMTRDTQHPDHPPRFHSAEVNRGLVSWLLDNLDIHISWPLIGGFIERTIRKKLDENLQQFNLPDLIVEALGSEGSSQWQHPVVLSFTKALAEATKKGLAALQASLAEDKRITSEGTREYVDVPSARKLVWRESLARDVRAIFEFLPIQKITNPEELAATAATHPSSFELFLRAKSTETDPIEGASKEDQVNYKILQGLAEKAPGEAHVHADIEERTCAALIEITENAIAQAIEYLKDNANFNELIIDGLNIAYKFLTVPTRVPSPSTLTTPASEIGALLRQFNESSSELARVLRTELTKCITAVRNITTPSTGAMNETDTTMALLPHCRGLLTATKELLQKITEAKEALPTASADRATWNALLGAITPKVEQLAERLGNIPDAPELQRLTDEIRDNLSDIVKISVDAALSREKATEEAERPSRFASQLLEHLRIELQTCCAAAQALSFPTDLAPESNLTEVLEPHYAELKKASELLHKRIGQAMRAPDGAFSAEDLAALITICETLMGRLAAVKQSLDAIRSDEIEARVRHKSELQKFHAMLDPARQLPSIPNPLPLEKTQLAFYVLTKRKVDLLAQAQEAQRQLQSATVRKDAILIRKWSAQWQERIQLCLDAGLLPNKDADISEPLARYVKVMQDCVRELTYLSDPEHRRSFTDLEARLALIDEALAAQAAADALRVGSREQRAASVIAAAKKQACVTAGFMTITADLTTVKGETERLLDGKRRSWISRLKDLMGAEITALEEERRETLASAAQHYQAQVQRAWKAVADESALLVKEPTLSEEVLPDYVDHVLKPMVQDYLRYIALLADRFIREPKNVAYVVQEALPNLTRKLRSLGRIV